MIVSLCKLEGLQNTCRIVAGLTATNVDLDVLS